MPILRQIEGAVDAIPEFTVVASEPGEDLRLSGCARLCQYAGRSAKLPVTRRWFSGTAASWSLFRPARAHALVRLGAG